MRIPISTVALIAALAAAPSFACGDALEGARRIESPRYVLAFRTVPRDIPMGRHFSVEFAVCARPGAPAPEAIQVDAVMPEHGHGMNYRPSVKAVTAERYVAEGLMFHMPGRWDFRFSVRGGGTTDRLVHTVRLE